MADILTEITPLSDKDCFDLVDRQKDSFTYPLHIHEEFERYAAHGTCNHDSTCSGTARDFWRQHDAPAAKPSQDVGLGKKEQCGGSKDDMVKGKACGYG